MDRQRRHHPRALVRVTVPSLPVRPSVTGHLRWQVSWEWENPRRPRVAPGRASQGRLQIRLSLSSHSWSSRHPDSSDAWDHAIKAVEAVLIPIVCPKKDKGDAWQRCRPAEIRTARMEVGAGQPGRDRGMQTLDAMLRLMWPNPDRHQDGTPRRKPTQHEAEAVIHTAVTIVQWARSGVLVKR
jgi:hypothetical protein